jgi:hypothetical protein
VITAILWRCTHNFCDATMRRGLPRFPSRVVEDRVTVLTYDRARCPILNQVPIERDARCMANRSAHPSLKRPVESITRNSRDCALKLYRHKPSSAGMHLSSRAFEQCSPAKVPDLRGACRQTGQQSNATPSAQSGCQRGGLSFLLLARGPT